MIKFNFVKNYRFLSNLYAVKMLLETVMTHQGEALSQTTEQLTACEATSHDKLILVSYKYYQDNFKHTDFVLHILSFDVKFTDLVAKNLEQTT